MFRDKTRVVHIGDKKIGGGMPVLVQSMTNTKTEDAEATIAQILQLEEAGCEIVRVAVPTVAAAEAIKVIKKAIHIPLVADIHFDHRLAILAMDYGVDKIRINPGNIGSRDKVLAVVERAKKDNIPIRVGVNSGSVEKEILEKYGRVTAEGIVESALNNVKIIEDMGYENLVISIKTSDVIMAIKAHELIASKTDYPLHVGVTEAGTKWAGTIKSTVGLSVILHEGIGDTIRVSLTGDPVEEVKVGYKILETMGLRERTTVEFVSCPTCGRTQIDLIALAKKVEERFSTLQATLKIAVMGCAVNGPGEAKEADFGVAAGKGEGILFKKGIVVKKVPEKELLNALEEEIMKEINSRREEE